MDAIRATWRNGQIVPDVPVDWPQGYRLRIEPDVVQAEPEEMREEDWSNSPVAIADRLSWYDSLEPLIFTPEEESDLSAWRRQVKEYTIANMNKSIEGLFK